MVIDFHTHAFSTKVVDKAISSLSKKAALIPYFDGTLAGLKNQMKIDGVDMCVVLNIVTNPKSQRVVNDFAIEVNNMPEFFGFGSVHPDAPDALDEIDYICDMGIKGVKLHPQYQNFYVDDKKMIKIYEKLAKKGLIVTFHAGDDIGFFGAKNFLPKNFLNIMGALEGAKVVLAHYGSFNMLDEVEKLLVDKNVYFDTSYSYGAMFKDQIERIIKNHRAERMLFGSDMPWSSFEHEKFVIECLDLTKEQKDNIFYKNAKELLHI